MTSIQSAHQNLAGLGSDTVNRNAQANVADENRRYDYRGKHPSSSRSFQSMLEKPSIQRQGVAKNPPDTNTMSRLTDLLEQLFQLLQKLQKSQPKPENTHSTDTQPPVMDIKPPMMDTQPPVMDTQPPVTDTQPPVTDTQPPVMDTNTKSQPLNSEQNLNALSLFGTTAFPGVQINHVEFVDNNADGKVSEGDDVLLFSEIDEQIGIDDSIRAPVEASYSQRHTLTAIEADQINQPVKPELQLNSDQQRAAFEVIFPNSYQQKGSVVDIRDNNGDGKVSEGDTAIHRVRNQHGSLEMGRVFLDAETAGRFEQAARPEIPLEISSNTLDALKERFSFNGPEATVIDKNNDGKLSTGDILRLSIPNGNHLKDITLTQEDVDVIKDNVDRLELSTEQNTVLEELLNNRVGFSNNVQKTVFTGTLLDRDGNGKISVGDGAITSTQNFVDDQPISTALRAEHTLTAEDLAKIDSVSVNTKIVSGGGVFVGENLTSEGIPDDRIVEINGQRYSVGFLKDQVENFAQFASTNKPSDGGLVAQVAGEFDWGYSSLKSAGHAFERYITDTFPRGEAKDAPGDIDYALPVSDAPKALSLTDQQNEILENKFIPQREGVTGSVAIFDTDGDNKISVGDQIKTEFSTEVVMLDDGRQGVGDAVGIGVVDASLLEELGILKPIDSLSPPVGEPGPAGPKGPVVDDPADSKPKSNFI